jgi:uncharacterized protein YukE
MRRFKMNATALRKKARRSSALKAMWKDGDLRQRHSNSLKQWYQENEVTQERIEKIRQSNIEFRKENPRTEEEKYACGNNMRGKKLEEILGEERAAVGKEARRQANYKQDYTGRGDKIAATRKANGSYVNSGMTGKEHKESTKEIMGIKATVRQDLKRKLGLGKNDKVPKDLLEKEYKKYNL